MFIILLNIIINRNLIIIVLLLVSLLLISLLLISLWWIVLLWIVRLLIILWVVWLRIVLWHALFSSAVSFERCVLTVDLGLKDADIGQVTVSLGIVQPVANDELVGAFEADVRAIDARLLLRELAQQRNHFYRCWIVLL